MDVGVEKSEWKFKHLKIILLRCTDYLHILLKNKSLYIQKQDTKFPNHQKKTQDKEN